MDEPALPFEPVYHLDIKTPFKIPFPGWIVGIGLSPYLRVSLNADRRSCEQSDHFRLSLLILEEASEDPSIRSFIGKVFLFYPSAWFVPMSSTCPFPDGLKDGVINGMEDGFTNRVTMIERPSAYLRVQISNEFACGQVFPFFDSLPDLTKKRLDVLLRWSDEELGAFPSAIFAHRLSKKVKSLFDMGDDCFLFRKFQSSFSHEMLHKRFDFLFQEFFGISCNDEVIRIPYQVYLRFPSLSARL